MDTNEIGDSRENRRWFLLAAASAPAALAACASAPEEGGRGPGAGRSGPAEVSPGEDLMQEHGVLDRILLVQGEAARRIEAGETFDPAVVRDAVGLLRRFVQDYHERLEEELVFPRLEAAGREAELVAVLRRQHRRGRELTDVITRHASEGSMRELPGPLRQLERMIRPHAAREETVLFPAFRRTLQAGEYRELGERFKEREHALLGRQGFEGAVAEVARLEAALDIAELARFTV